MGRPKYFFYSIDFISLFVSISFSHKVYEFFSLQGVYIQILT